MNRRNHFDSGHGKPEHTEDDGPYCNNCSDDIEEVFEWTGPDRQAIHPSKRVPCKGCGAV